MDEALQKRVIANLEDQVARLQAENAAVEQRNANRRGWRDALRRGGGELTKRLEAARSYAASSLRIVSEEEVEFDSAKGIEEVDEMAAGLDDFDRRLREAEQGRDRA